MRWTWPLFDIVSTAGVWKRIEVKLRTYNAIAKATYTMFPCPTQKARRFALKYPSLYQPVRFLEDKGKYKAQH